MSDILERTPEYLANKLIVRLECAEPTQRILVGICGVPGSGKSTLAALVCAHINAKNKETNAYQSPLAVAAPMDGFHYSRSQLSAMPDPKGAHHRRGAAFTFDGEGFLRLIRQLSDPAVIASKQTIFAPSFDHELKDPVDDGIVIPAQSRIVLIEGNYCGLDRRPWSDAAELMSEIWYVDVPRDVAHERLARRHLESKIVADEQEAWARAQGTDELNAEDIRSNLRRVHEVVTTG